MRFLIPEFTTCESCEEEVCIACRSFKQSIDEPELCSQCSGSGEGQYEDTTCWSCHGNGTLSNVEA